ncbi:MAG: type II secretion system protein [Candidatus Gastranaerophilaceae bacterium]
MTEKSGRRLGFTLAEVLITLGIIGVVAAMTIPTLIANTNGAKFRSQFKKSLSTLNQAGLMAQAQYDFDYAGTTASCIDASVDGTTGAQQKPDSVMSMCSLFNGTLTGQTYVGTVDNLKRNNNGAEADYTITSVTLPATATGFYAYTLADGAIVAFSRAAIGCHLPIGQQLTDTYMEANLASCIGFIDVNGVTLPNKEVTCSVGDTSHAVQTPCVVKNDATHMTDIFPIVFHDATVEPASNAAKYVLTSAK